MHRFLIGLLVVLAGCATADQMVRDAIATPRVVNATWATDASALRGEVGRFVYVCPASPAAHERDEAVWGSSVYTDDSSVCRAGVHAGAISFASGGRVTIELRPGQASYRGTDWNGVTTLDYGSWDYSFAVIR